MSIKYLGNEFDIHGGGLDLMFPHHECEIAQNTAVEKKQVVKYWMHNNMITVEGQKMGKSLNNFINLEEFFTGNHAKLEMAYSPMTIRFFILQAHYRSTVDFSNHALQSADKGLNRLLDAYAKIEKLTASDSSSVDLSGYRQKCYDALNDDMNSAIVISQLFDVATIINSAHAGTITLSANDIEETQFLFNTFLFEILGLKNEAISNDGSYESFSKALDLLLEIRDKAKANKDWATSDQIRDELAKAGFEVKDGKDGAEWKLK